MSLNLDARQRAMLQEMGHPLWWPESAAPEATQAPAENLAQKQALTVDLQAPEAPQTIATARTDAKALTPPAQTTPVAAPPAARPPPSTPTRPAAPAPAPPQVQPLPQDFPRVRFALRAPVLLDLREPKAQTEPAPATTQPAWLVVAELPEGTPPQGQAGQLVINMLRAMRLTDAPVYWVPLARIAPDQGEPQDETDHSMDALVQDLQPCMALALGLPAARHLMPGDQPFASLRQQVHRIGAAQLPTVVSYDPSHLLRTPKAKADTWADLCLALASAGR